MNTTTYTGTGVNGQKVSKELADKGQIVVITTGSTKFRTYREVTGEVIGHNARSISGTQFFVWETVVRTADGETITDTRVRPANDAEAAEFTAAPVAEAVTVEYPEDVALTAHNAACFKCGNGRICDEGVRLRAARHNVQHWSKAPIVTTDQWGHRHGFWNIEYALADVAINGGEVTKAPAGMLEAAARKRVADRQEREARRAARRAAGIRIRPPRR
ncbi:hypothetical protein [Streptomyces sp. NPDC059278]|uniref:hypothetical protein n=1 Tax=Streptomyces sp. NPDC059278 TaxID=3346801 RepID=UPI0036B47DDB